MQLPLRIDPAAGMGLQAQVTDQIRQLILDGRLTPGARMPATRQLALDLGVSRNTVMGAFERLAAEGLIEAREPTGTFVAGRIVAEGPALLPLPEATISVAAERRRRRRLKLRVEGHQVVAPHGPALPFDFWIGRPDARLFPMRHWQALLMRKLRGGARHQGELALRQAVAAHVGATRGIAAAAQDILVTNGIQEGLNLLAWLLIAPGIEVVVENPCYRGAAQVFRGHGARLRPVAVDHDGLDCAALPTSAALAYVTPSHQYPLGATLSIERRQALLGWAAQAGAYVVEDDYDCDFFYDGTPLPALKSLDRHGHVIYLGTFSKSLGAGLRIGYMVLPTELREPARRAKALLNNCQPWLEQAALAAFITEGGYAEHLRRLRQSYAARRDHLCAGISHGLPGWHCGGGGSGMHLVAHLPPQGPDAEAVEKLARTQGVGVYSIARGNALLWNAGPDHPLRRVLLLGYAALSQTEISEALLRLRQAIGAH